MQLGAQGSSVLARGRKGEESMDHAAQWTKQAAGALFMGLEREAADALLDAASQRRFEAGTTLFHQGDAPDQLFQVRTGLVKMSRVNPDGAQTMLRYMGPGDLIGCVAVFRRTPYPATASTVRPTTALGWGAQRILELMQRYPAISANALGIVGDRAREMVDRVSDLTDKGTEARIASVLLKLADQIGRRSASGIEVATPGMRRDIAEMTNLNYFTVSRMLGAWQASGIVRVARGRILILEPRRLLQIAG